jgi:hypothetical protein
MRTGGLPCRVLACGRAFAVVDQRSMESLKAAGNARNEHEISAHGYHHVVLEDHRALLPFVRTSRKNGGTT